MANISSYNQLSSWNEDDDLLFVQQPDAPKKAHPSQMKEYILRGLDVSSVGGTGKYISAISETDGKISATAETMDVTPTEDSTKAVTSGGIKTAIDDSVSLKTATGNPITLTDAANANAEKLSMTIEPIQSGSGDPSPTNVRPISGISEAVVTRTGKNLFGNFELNKSISSETGENIDDVGGFRTAGKIRTDGYNAISLTFLDSDYKGSFIVLQYSDGAYIGVVAEIQCSQIQYPYNRTLTLNPETTYIRIRGWHGANVSSINTAQFQVTLGTTPTAYEPYTAATVSITLDQTVYGGSVNFKTGEVTVTHANIASYNGESINEPWLSSIDKYVSGATPTTGAQVVYPLTTPTTLTLTPAELELLKGANTITANGAEISIEYYPDNAIGALAERVDNKADKEDVDAKIGDLSQTGLTGDSVAGQLGDAKGQIDRFNNNMLPNNLNAYTNNGVRTIYQSVIAYINGLSGPNKPRGFVQFYITYDANTMPSDLPSNTTPWQYAWGEIYFRNGYIDATIILHPYADDGTMLIKQVIHEVEKTWQTVLTDKSVDGKRYKLYSQDFTNVDISAAWGGWYITAGSVLSISYSDLGLTEPPAAVFLSVGTQNNAFMIMQTEFTESAVNFHLVRPNSVTGVRATINALVVY